MGGMLSLMFLPFGRASRIAFLGGFGALMLLSPLLTMLAGPLESAPFQLGGAPSVAPPTLFVTTWVVFCLFANRLHDIGRSALWAGAPILAPMLVMSGLAGFSQSAVGWGGSFAVVFGPLLSMAMALALLCLRGHDGPNRFGQRPAIA